MDRKARVAGGLLALAAALALAGDAPDRGRALLRLAPGLDHEAAFHLIHDSPGELLEYCRAIGPVQTLDMLGWLNASVRTESRSAYDRSHRLLYPYTSRVADIMASEFDRPEFARLYAFRASLGPRGFEHRQRLTQLNRVQNDPHMSLAEKVERYRELEFEFARFGDPREVMNIEAALARDVMRAGMLDKRIALLRSALTRARRLGEQLMACQLLGELGHCHGILEQNDSLLVCYREGIARADRYRIPDQAARLRVFLALHYMGEGRLASCAELLREAQAASQRLGGSPLEIRVVLTAMSWYARLGCWDLVGQTAERIPVLLRALERRGYTDQARRHRVEASRLHGAWLAATGRPQEGADSLDHLLEAVRWTADRELLGPILLQRTRTLLEAGRFERCLNAVDSALAIGDSIHLPHLKAELMLIRARAAIAGQRPDVARRALADLRQEALRTDDESPPMPAFLIAGLEATIAEHDGQSRLAEQALLRGLGAFRDTLATLDGGPESAMWLQDADDLWRVGRRLSSHSARASLDFERYRRSLIHSVSLGAFGRSRDAAPPPDRADDAGDVLELTFAELPEGLVRWSRSRGAIRRDLLTLEAGRCARLVDRLVELASRDPLLPDAPVPDELVRLSGELARALLPAGPLLTGSRRVHIACEGALSRLPFELLDVSADGHYEPLLLSHDVTYVRHVRPRRQRPDPGRHVILSNADRLHPAGTAASLPPLPALSGEISRVLAALPNAAIVQAHRASKQALFESFRSARTIYIAAHLVRDPEAPLFNYFPIAFDSAAAMPGDRYLDIHDVRSADLTACRLVVLSSCASGEPYVDGPRAAPSMAEAFVDAGAAAAIHTRWRVRDDLAAVAAPRLLAAWRERETGDPGAWNKARRELVIGPAGIRHPFQWAAWAVTRAEPVPEWRGVPSRAIGPPARAELAAHERRATSPERGE